MNPKVSIIMCAYNRAAYLPEAIESVLAQDFQDWELLVLDDASTDDTQAVMDRYIGYQRIRHIRHAENVGLAKNRIAGLKESRGEYIAILDSDDRWNDIFKLSKQAAFLDENPGYGIIGTFANVINENGSLSDRFSFEIEDVPIRKRMLLRDQIVNSSSLFRKKIAKDVGGYDENLAPAEDYDLFLRMGIKSKFANIDEFMTDYRVHAENSSSMNKAHHAKLHLQIIQKYRKDYPNYFPALIKAYLRIIQASF